MYKIKIRERIEDSGFTYDEIASKLGITRSTLFSYATNPNPKIGVLDRIAVAIGCSIEDLYDFTPSADNQKKYVTRKSKREQRKEMRLHDEQVRLGDVDSPEDNSSVYTPIILLEENNEEDEGGKDEDSIEQKRIQALLSTMKNFHCPTEAIVIKRTINRSEWGGKIMTKDVINLLKQLPEILESPKGLYMLIG